MKNILFVILWFIVLSSNSQELNCRIQIVSTQIQGTNKEIFKDMQKAIFEFMNNTQWTNHVYSLEERIE